MYNAGEGVVGVAQKMGGKANGKLHMMGLERHAASPQMFCRRWQTKGPLPQQITMTIHACLRHWPKENQPLKALYMDKA